MLPLPWALMYCALYYSIVVIVRATRPMYTAVNFLFLCDITNIITVTLA